ncbi:DnaJ C-terminal domain-containing protein [Jonquetella anthropi]|uniref:DnaJ C-terminal domain-containing protein n=1 Tax=Jonquetella anthropi TaxID=428712 RepID=UPI0001B91043|nr:DnaJ C-terminal domain-containing protein [Jonquetella anthropi]EEX49087.1 DnaJ domain protein [Jonquetella anthropi E3_33 E1]
MTASYKDYYKILGVERTADGAAIKSAYRKLAKKYHPDVNKAPDAEARYKDINEAYEVLNDPQKRATYDQLGPDWQSASQGAGGFGGFPGGTRVDFGGAGDFSEFFRTIFGGFGGGGRTFHSSAGRRGSDVEASIELSIREAFHAPMRKTLTLRDERGSREIEVNLPRGLSDGTRLRLRGQGSPGLGGGPNGDLFVTVRFRTDPVFAVQGWDLEVKVPVAPWDAALGGTAKVPTVDGSVTVKIPAGTRGGMRLRLKGRGLPLREESLSGDLFARVEITTPQSLTPQQKELWERLRALA